MLILLVAAIACEPVEQQGLSRDEIRQVVRVEVNSQIEAAKEEMSQDFGPGQGDFQFELMQPLDDLRFEVDNLRNQVEGTDYVSKFDLDSLSLDIQELWSSINGLDFEYAKRGELSELQFQVDDVRNSIEFSNIGSDQGTDLDQLRFEIDETRSMIEDAKNESYFELEQLRLQVEDMERVLNDFQGDFGLDLDRLRSRLDAMR
jgi:hypothetical protein